MTIFSTLESIEQAWEKRRGTLQETRRQTIERRERILRSAIAKGIPTTRSEDWKYTSLRPLIEQKFDLIGALAAEKTHLDAETVEQLKARLAPNAIPVVFVDGRLDLSWPGSEALDPDFFRSLSSAELEEDSSWWDSWQSSCGMDGLFAGLNAGLAHEGVVIGLNRRQVLARPIHILHVATKHNRLAARVNRVLISVPECAKLRVYEEFIAVDQEVGEWSNVLTQFKLGPLADCGYYRIIASPGSYHTGSVTASLEKGSRLETFSLTAGSRFARINMDIQYNAPDAECILNGLYLACRNEHVDHHTAVEHRVGNCRTHQFYKGIMADQSRAVFNGKIFIRKDAQGTEAYQTNKNLLLSTEAEVDTKPQLEIDADDVKASHGAAIGSIDPLELFYLQSRCIGRAEAMAMLCRGFANDAVLRLGDDVAKNLLGQRVGEWFKSLVDRMGVLQ